MIEKKEEKEEKGPNKVLIILVGVVLFYLTIFVIFAYVIYRVRSNYIQRSQFQSDYCLLFTCPCDDPTSAPCFGYPKLKMDNGNWVCLGNPTLEVNDSGVPI